MLTWEQLNKVCVPEYTEDDYIDELANEAWELAEDLAEYLAEKYAEDAGDVAVVAGQVPGLAWQCIAGQRFAANSLYVTFFNCAYEALL